MPLNHIFNTFNTSYCTAFSVFVCPNNFWRNFRPNGLIKKKICALYSRPHLSLLPIAPAHNFTDIRLCFRTRFSCQLWWISRDRCCFPITFCSRSVPALPDSSNALKNPKPFLIYFSFLSSPFFQTSFLPAVKNQKRSRFYLCLIALIRTVFSLIKKALLVFFKVSWQNHIDISFCHM